MMDPPVERMVYDIRVWRWSFNLRAITVEPVIFLYMFTAFIQVMTFQALLYEKVCQENFNATVCSHLDNASFKQQETTVQEISSKWILYSNLAMAIPSLVVVCLFLGPFGDRVGHKVPVIVTLVGIMLASASHLVNSVYVTAPIPFLLAGPVLFGLCGGIIGSLMAIYSYIACLCTEENRTVRMGILEGLTFLSGTLGAVVSGVLLDKTSYVFVFSFLLCVIILCLMYAVAYLKNVKPVPEETTAVSSQGCCQRMGLASTMDLFSCVYNKRRSENFIFLGTMMFILFCLTVIYIGETDIILIFTRHPPLSWSQTTLGLYRATEAFIRGIAVVTLLPFAKRVMKFRDTTIMICGLVSRAAAFVVLGLATKTAVIFIGSVTGLLQGFTSAAIRSVCSGMVEVNQQAKMFSVIAILECVGQLVATSLFNSVYYATVDVYSGFSFLMAAGISIICLLIAVWLHVKKVGQQTYSTLQEDPTLDSTEESLQIQQNQVVTT